MVMKVDAQHAVRVRFAPSPTGHLHIGGLRTALFNWLFAHHNKGLYLLRIEDTDGARSTNEYLASQLASLAWAGIESSEPIVYQMSRATEHHKAALGLVEQGKAYPCFCEPRDADDVVTSLDAGLGQKYDKTCRDKAYTLDDLKNPHAIRFKLPYGLENVRFLDIVRGKIAVKAEYFDDFVIIRRDGSPIYNFCVVVDDIFMRITHIIRGEDHIPNTTKQVLLYEALGAQTPAFAHLPLILGQDGSKLSKRDAAVSVEEYRASGFLPEALLNYLVRLGWSHGDQEVFSRAELIEHFSLDHVGKKGAVFDIKKLEWMNGVYIRQSSVEKLVRAISQMNTYTFDQLVRAWGTEKLHNLIEAYKERSVTLKDLATQILALADVPEKLDLKLIEKWRNAKTALLLTSFVEKVKNASDLGHDALLAEANVVCEQHGEKLVHLAQTIRLALTGSIQSPGVFGLIEILGRHETVERLERVGENL